MSTNFTGITFAQQKVLPSDDAIIRRAILPDGILYGCEISYSGSTLTMAAGQLMICGRQIRHPSSQNWAVADATSGFARLVLTIDLTRASSKDTFDQVVDTVEYASSEDGFAALEQADVNVSGIRYQVAACVVSLGAGGITGIVSQLEKSRAEGGGLNFSVVGGLTQPTDPKENTIWVNTDQKIPGYALSATEPEAPEEGMVWITIGTESGVAFNALKKNAIMVYPISAKQHINGAWVEKTAKSYQSGKWVDWWGGYLYKNGDEYVDITGGWEWETNCDGSFTKNADNMYLHTIGKTATYGYAVVHTANRIDLTSYSKLAVKTTGWSDTGGEIYPRIGVHPTVPSDYSGLRNIAAYIDSGTELDISGLSGEYYVLFGCAIGGSTSLNHYITVNEMHLK